MPNWADVTYVCKGKSEQVKDLYSKIEELEKESRVPNGFGNLWLGNLVDLLGGNCETAMCRGEITMYEISDDGTELLINQNCAWGEQEGVREIIENTYDTINVFYLVEEPGCDVFYTNDLDHNYFKEKYHVSSDDLWDYYETLDEVADAINDTYHPQNLLTAKNVINWIEKYNEENEDDSIYFRRIDYDD